MSIEFKEGSLFDSPFDAIVNPVNCVGVMGAGLALQFKWRFPKNFDEYHAACMARKLHPGNVFVHCTGMECPRYVFNFPTKMHWRDHSKLRYINSGLADLARWTDKLHVSSIAIPPLGCGLGGLKWNEVKPLIVEAFSPFQQLEVSIFVPRNNLQETNGKSIIR